MGGQERDMQQKIKALTEKYGPAVVALRRHFHANPELSGQEFATQEKIITVLQQLELTPRRIAGTGVVVELQGSKPGETIAIRADMDALPVQDECGQPYQSTVAGVCHACGHDGHVAMLLGVAMILAEMREELQGSVRLLFQPSEEKLPGGALRMIEAGALQGVTQIIAAHLWQPVPVGKLAISYDRMMASAAVFRITVQGHGGHSSMPQQAVNPILVGVEVVAALNAIASCNVDPLETVALSVGVFQSGEAENIIPDVAEIKGSVRCFDEALRQDVFRRIETICAGICQANGATFSLEKLFGYPAVLNHSGVVSGIVAAGSTVLGKAAVEIMRPAMAAEDFAYYLQQIPGALMFIGAGNTERGIIYPHHHPRFDIDEQALAYGVETMVTAVIQLLGEASDAPIYNKGKKE
jgi:amidohydrolase